MTKIVQAGNNLGTIIHLARGCSGKRLSELTELEKHAVAFCGYIKKFRIADDPSKLKVIPQKDKDVYEGGSAIGGAVMKLKKLLAKPEFSSCKEKNLNPNSFYVVIDEELPKFKLGSIDAALTNYPDLLLVPDDAFKDYADGAPPILPSAVTPSSNKEALADEFMLLANNLLFQMFSPNQHLNKTMQFTVFLIQTQLARDDKFINELRKLVPYFPRYYKNIELEDYDFELPEDLGGDYNLESMKETFKDPRLAAVFWALRGKFVTLSSIK